jgi:dienelactone hydrolase
VLLGPLFIPVAASAAEAEGKVMPFDLPVSARELKSGHRPVLSHSGHLLAYTVGERPITSSGADRFMSNGVPGQIPNTAIWLVDLVSGETKAIGQGVGNCWRPVFSPDEKSIASYCDGGDAPQLWIHDLASGKSRRISEARIKASLWTGDEPIWLPGGEQLLAPLVPEPLSSGARPESGPAAAVTFQTTGGASSGAAPASDASAIALAKHVETLFHADLAAIDVAGGRVRTIVSHDYAKPPSAMLLSPSGRWISFISHVGNETGGARPNIDLGVAPVGGGAAKLVAERLTRMESHYLKGSHFWHPVRDEIFWVQDGGLWTAGADDGFTPHRVSAKLSTAIPDALGLMNDGNALVVGIDPLDDPAYLEPHPGAFELVRLDGRAGRRIEIPSGFLADNLVRDGDGRLWQPDANSVAARARERATGKTAVLRLDILSGAVSSMWTDFATIDPVGQVRGSQDLLAIYEDNSTPEDIIRFNPDLSIKQRVSHVEPRLDGFTFAPPVLFDTPVNRLDGAGNSVKSALYLPPGAKRGDRLPTVVTVYPRSTTRVGKFGGGFQQTMPASIFTTRGYAVLVTELPVRPLGEISPSVVDDVKGLLTPQIRHASDLGYVDMSRLAVMGQSFGGYTTASLLIESDLFRGGIALAGAYDLTYLTAFMGKNRDFGYPPGAIEQYWNIKGLPWANMDSYIQLSPFFQAGRMQAPILIAHGSNDLIPIEDARKMFNALRFAGKTAEFAEYAGEAHVPSHWSTANAADLGRRAIDFLDRYVKPAREPGSSVANAVSP